MRIIAGTHKGRTLKTTTGPGFRPAMGKVREALFAMLEARGVVWPDCRVLDLFAGSGSLGFEAISRGAAFTAFVDSTAHAAKVIHANAELLGVPQSHYRVIKNETGKVLGKRPDQPYDVVFIDPPYQLNALGRTLNALVKNDWLSPDAIVNAEVEERLKFSPDKAHEALETLEDRSYGQTRVLLWTMKK